MASKTVDIIMAVYNGEKFIGAQIESIRCQTHTDWQLWIRDDLSSDSTIAIVESLAAKDKRIRVVQRSSHRLGPSGNFSGLMEIVLEQSSMPYTAFSDQDDVWHSNKITLLIKEIEKIEQSGKVAALVYSDMSVVDENLKSISKSFFKCARLNINRHGVNQIVMQNTISGCSLMMNRALLKLCTPVPSAIMFHDWWIAVVASVFGRISYIKEPLLCYRQHPFNQVGVRKRTAIDHLRKFFLVLSKTMFLPGVGRHIVIAQAFAARFNMEIPEENRSMFAALESLNRPGYFKRVKIIIKYGLFRHGLLRNVVLFLVLNNMVQRKYCGEERFTVCLATPK